MLSPAWSANSWKFKLKSQTSSENHFSTTRALCSHVLFMCCWPCLLSFCATNLKSLPKKVLFILYFDKLNLNFCARNRFQLKQEQENRRNTTMMYNTTRDKLRRTEEQQQLEVQERQKVELTLRNLELEMRTMINNMKQVIPLKYPSKYVVTFWNLCL